MGHHLVVPDLHIFFGMLKQGYFPKDTVNFPKIPTMLRIRFKETSTVEAGNTSYVYMGVSIHGVPNSWMVSFMENPI